MNDLTEEFLKRYRELEDLAKLKYNVEENAIAKMERSNEYFKYKNKIKYCREVRNFLSHNRGLENSFAVEVSEAMIKLIDELIDELTCTANDIMIHSKFIASCKIEDKIMPAMRLMSEKCYTHIPVLENGVLKGVFSENTLLSYIIDDKIVEIDENTTFSDIAKYLPVEAHRGETFRFIPDNLAVTSIAELFRKAMGKQERIGMVFVTKGGKPTEKVKGIITAWDLSII